MSSEPVINVQELLSPIPGENPAGENLRYSGVHDQIREARRAEEALEQGDWKRDTKTADWPEVSFDLFPVVPSEAGWETYMSSRTSSVTLSP